MASEWAVERLRACALFAQARPEVLAEVARAFRRRRFRRNEVIFHQGDPGDSLHIIATGAVRDRGFLGRR
jgi:CRP-like cAMP-binding protein